MKHDEYEDCKSNTGITVGLIDSILCIAAVIRERNLSSTEVQEALKDIRDCENMKWLMNMGELSDAKDYIKKLKDEIKVMIALSNAVIDNNITQTKSQ